MHMLLGAVMLPCRLGLCEISLRPKLCSSTHPDVPLISSHAVAICLTFYSWLGANFRTFHRVTPTLMGLYEFVILAVLYTDAIMALWQLGRSSIMASFCCVTKSFHKSRSMLKFATQLKRGLRWWANFPCDAPYWRVCHKNFLLAGQYYSTFQFITWLCWQTPTLTQNQFLLIFCCSNFSTSSHSSVDHENQKTNLELVWWNFVLRQLGFWSLRPTHTARIDGRTWNPPLNISILNCCFIYKMLCWIF